MSQNPLEIFTSGFGRASEFSLICGGMGGAQTLCSSDMFWLVMLVQVTFPVLPPVLLLAPTF